MINGKAALSNYTQYTNTRTNVRERNQANGKTTLRLFLQEWLKTIKLGAKPNTYTAYHGYIFNYILSSCIADMRLRDIKPGDVQAFTNSIKGRNGRKLSGKTVRLVYDMLKTALTYAVDYDCIEKNPCYKIRLPRHTPKEIRILSTSEQAALEQAITESKNGKAFGVLICLYTGIRLGELCALKWSDIDFENREISVRRSLSRITLHDSKSKTKTAIVEDTPKTLKSNRAIPLPMFLIKQLKERKKISKSEYVVSMKDGRRVLPRTMQDVFAGLIKNSGIAHTNFHALRHTFATRAIELNVNVCAVSEILGHSNISITISRYIHALKEQKLDAARLFDRFYKEKSIKKAIKKPPYSD